MHPTIESLTIILFSSVCLYTCFLIYIKATKSLTVKDLIPTEKQEEYNTLKNKHNIVFIIGLLIGFAIVLVKDKTIIKTIVNNKYVNISDVEDISVL